MFNALYIAVVYIDESDWMTQFQTFMFLCSYKQRMSLKEVDLSFRFWMMYRNLLRFFK